MNKLAATLSTLAFLTSVPQYSQANDAIADFSGLIGEVNADNVGAELILPSMVYANGGLDLSMTVSGLDLAASPGTSLYQTASVALTKPVLNCVGQYWNNGDETWKFLRFGKFVVAATSLSEECAGSQGHLSANNSYVYVVDASSAGSIPVLLQYAGKRLLGLNLTDDLNQAGSASDLMVSLLDEASGQMTVTVYDFLNGAVYSTNAVQVVTE